MIVHVVKYRFVGEITNAHVSSPVLNRISGVAIAELILLGVFVCASIYTGRIDNILDWLVVLGESSVDLEATAFFNSVTSSS